MRDFSCPLGDAVRQARNDKQLTQRKLANLIDRDVRTIINIENYNANPKMEVMYPLIRELSMDPTKIFYPENETGGEAYRKMHILLSECNENDIEMLYAICKAVLSVLYSGDNESGSASS